MPMRGTMLMGGIREVYIAEAMESLTRGSSIAALGLACLCSRHRCSLPTRAVIRDYTRRPRSHWPLATMVLVNCAVLRALRHLLLYAYL
jgi:hypothetical protein